MRLDPHPRTTAKSLRIVLNSGWSLDLNGLAISIRLVGLDGNRRVVLPVLLVRPNNMLIHMNDLLHSSFSKSICRTVLG